MADILSITPPLEPQGLDTLSPDVARDIQRDTMRLAWHDAWFNGLIGVAFLAATAVMTWLEYRRPLRLSAAIRPPLPWQFGLFSALAFLAALDAWRAYRRMRAADAAQAFDSADALTTGSRMPQHHRSWASRRSRQIILVLLLLGLGFQFATRIRPITGPIVFLNATIRTGTGFPQEHMTVAVADGRVAFVGGSDDELPATLAGARKLDAGSALVSAATFDHSVDEPLDALRHIWVGQLYEGAPGDLVISNHTGIFGRGRNRMPEPREILGAVVNGRYYSSGDLQKQR